MNDVALRIGVDRLHDDGGNLEFASAECIDERIDNLRIEVGPCALDDDLFSPRTATWLCNKADRSSASHNVRDGDDARFDGNLVAAIGMVAGAVELVVM